MNYISTPVTSSSADSGVWLQRDIEEEITMFDNLVELIVFTPKGSFAGDPDFGFEYWNHEYSNVQYREFNNGHTGLAMKGINSGMSKEACEESIRQSLQAYAPGLKQVVVTMLMDAAEAGVLKGKKVFSKYVVTINVEGIIDDGLGTTCKYEKSVVFMVEPTVKRYSI